MEKKTILIESEKYQHNIKEAYFEITDEMLKLRNLNLKFRECEVQVDIILKLEEDKQALVTGFVDKNLSLVYIINEYGYHEDVYNDTFTSSTLCAIQDVVQLNK